MLKLFQYGLLWPSTAKSSSLTFTQIGKCPPKTRVDKDEDTTGRSRRAYLRISFVAVITPYHPTPKEGRLGNAISIRETSLFATTTPPRRKLKCSRIRTFELQATSFDVSTYFQTMFLNTIPTCRVSGVAVGYLDIDMNFVNNISSSIKYFEFLHGYLVGTYIAFNEVLNIFYRNSDQIRIKTIFVQLKRLLAIFTKGVQYCRLHRKTIQF